MDKIRLNNSILGYMLIPLTQGARETLSLLYGTDYDKMSNKEKALGGSLKDAIANIKDVAKSLDIKISFCGSKYNPTIRIWKKIKVKPDEFNVDLKYSLWTDDKSIWEQFAPKVYERMKKSFAGEDKPVKIFLSPKKEIHYGFVLVSKGSCSGSFSTEWDEAEELAYLLDTECSDSFIDSLPVSTHTEGFGVGVKFNIKARKFSNFLTKIYKQNNLLVDNDRKIWNVLEKMYKA